MPSGAHLARHKGRSHCPSGDEFAFVWQHLPDPSVFRSGRQFAAWLGLVPRQNSSGGKERLGRVSKMGNGYLRRLLVVGATSVTRRASSADTRTGAWVRSLLERKPKRLVTVAIANKTARVAWALLSKGETYRAAPAN